MEKQETKLCHNDYPNQPDMSAPFPTWKEKVEEYRLVIYFNCLILVYYSQLSKGFYHDSDLIFVLALLRAPVLLGAR